MNACGATVRRDRWDLIQRGGTFGVACLIAPLFAPWIALTGSAAEDSAGDCLAGYSAADRFELRLSRRGRRIGGVGRIQRLPDDVDFGRSVCLVGSSSPSLDVVAFRCPHSAWRCRWRSTFCSSSSPSRQLRTSGCTPRGAFLILQVFFVFVYLISWIRTRGGRAIRGDVALVLGSCSRARSSSSRPNPPKDSRCLVFGCWSTDRRRISGDRDSTGLSVLQSMRRLIWKCCWRRRSPFLRRVWDAPSR